MPMNRNALTKGSASLATDKDSWLYETTEASTATLVSGYFDEATQQFNLGDLITVKASDGTFLLKVDTDQGAIPCIASLFSTGGGGSLPDIAPFSVLANNTASIAQPIGVLLGESMNMDGGTLNAIIGGTAGGDLVGTYPNPDIGNNKVTYGKVQQVSAVKLLGNPTAAEADLQEIGLDPSLEFDGANLKVVPGALDPIAAQTLLGNPTAATAIPTAISLGTNLSFSGSILNASVPDQLTWDDVSSNTTMSPNKGYNCTGSSFILNLPVTMQRGQVIKIINQTTSDIQINQNSGQTITNANQSTTTGTSGNLKSLGQGTSFTLLCIVDNTNFILTDIGPPYIIGQIPVPPGLALFDFT